ncbi:SDR family oxidoreductase [Alkalihalobacterium chitinilyticum]|uniref:SDR family oxidoreductase n=1 Tax=Alkalihalobacterium chitinilyticum TaxID=2980103 RepID=A0ABT5VA37_9BACI|nr:SDR family oxidoreductase [Alkalihalobacterium chitinilyticum]MDE5412310.1 SDR family oxidoreductase [Alkalihalobacterium chitinilyticum]
MRHAIVTAGTKGLGLKVTEQLLEEGYSVTVSYRSDVSAVENLKKRWEAKADQLQFVRADVTKKADLDELIQSSIQKFNKIDIFIHNAGPYIFERKKLVDYADDEWYEMVEGNLSSFFHIAKGVIPLMRQQKFGRIIAYGFQGANDAPGWIYRSAYAAAKVGLVSLMKTLAIEEAEHGITVNMVCPGNILGEMKEATIEQSRQFFDEKTPVGRSGTGEDIARAISFLCQDNSDMITGTVLEITGGLDVINSHR